MTEILLALMLLAAPQRGQAPAPSSPGAIDEAIPSGANFDKAEFRLWVPGYVGDIHTFAVTPRKESTQKDITSWFVSARLAEAWRDAVKK